MLFAAVFRFWRAWFLGMVQVVYNDLESIGCAQAASGLCCLRGGNALLMYGKYGGNASRLRIERGDNASLARTERDGSAPLAMSVQ